MRFYALKKGCRSFIVQMRLMLIVIDFKPMPGLLRHQGIPEIENKR
jgi:hypothetical protein